MAPRLVVVLVNPKHPGNIGSTARVLRNFGLEELWLVDPACEVGPEARKFAMHAWDLLDKARVFPTLEACLAELDLAVGTASDIATNEKRDFLRIPLRLREAAPRVHELGGTVGLLFGREDFGLTNEELESCDLLVTIPAAPQHPSLNLSHAVAVVCYELTESRHHVKRPRQASREETERLLGFVDRMLDLLGLPAHRKRTTMLTFRKMLGRAMMSRWEYHRLMGVFNGALRAMEELERQGKPVRSLRRVERAPRKALASKSPGVPQPEEPEPQPRAHNR